MTSPDAFVWSDAWLMYSILAALRRGDASLMDVIEAGDAINHAIFTTEEINGGVERLVRAGLVTVSDHAISPSQVASYLWMQARESARTAWDVLTKLRELMNGLDSAPESPAPKRFEEAEILTAFAAYHERFQSALRKLEERDPKSDI